jgi:hypothetical protein
MPEYERKPAQEPDDASQNFELKSHWQKLLWHVRPKSTLQVLSEAQEVLFSVLGKHESVLASKYVVEVHWHLLFVHCIGPRHWLVDVHVTYSLNFGKHFKLVKSK